MAKARSARAINRWKKTRIRNLQYGPKEVYYMASSSYGDRKQVQDARFDSHLTGVKKESFYWLTKTIAYNKGLPRKWKQIGHVEKVYLVKTKSAVSFSSLM